MFEHNINPVLLDLGFLEIRYYGLVYVLGFLFALFWLLKFKDRMGFSKEEVYDLVFYLIVGGVVGSRVFHILFWEPGFYFANPMEILKFWKGGMAFHGGVVGGLIGGWLYWLKRKFNFWKVADLLTIPMAIVFAFGRIANFINAELVGSFSNAPWCVDFGDGCRHPVQLYSALKRFLVAGLLFFVSKKKHKDGFLFFLMITLFGLGRFFIDFVRVDELYFGLSMGQWTSALMFLVGLIVLIKWYMKDFRKIFK